MNIDQEGLLKGIYVGLLLTFIAVCDKAGINDPMLRDAAFSMIGIITGWHGVNKLIGSNSATSVALSKIAAAIAPTPKASDTPTPPAA